VSDPFKGQFYRIAANLHQTPFIFLHGKLYCYLGNKFFSPKTNQLNKEQIGVLNKKKQEILKSIEKPSLLGSDTYNLIDFHRKCCCKCDLNKENGECEEKSETRIETLQDLTNKKEN
jgi:hypothetical protein